MSSLFETLTKKQQAIWRENSRKGGQACRGEPKRRAAKLSWQRSPDRFTKHKPRPVGFACTVCGHWHPFPPDMEWTARTPHQCRCGALHTIVRGKAIKRKRAV